METNRFRSPFLRVVGLVITLLGIAPLFVLLRAPSAEGLRTLAPLAVCLLCYPISLLKKSRRVIILIIACVLGFAIAVRITRNETGIEKYVYILLSFLAPAYSLPSIYHERLQYEIGIGFVGTILSWLLLRGDVGVDARPEVFRLAVAFLPLTLLYINLSQIERERNAQKSGQMNGMRVSNAVMTGIAAILAFMLANAREIWDWLKKLVKMIIELFLRIFASSPENAAHPDSGERAGMMLLPPSEGEPSIVLKILEILAFAAAALFIAWAIIKLLRKLPAAITKLIRRIKDILMKYVRSISAEEIGYVDTSESINASETKIKNRKRFRKQRLPRWDELDNRRKIRAAYRYAVADRAKPYQSAAENLSEALYERPDAAQLLAQSYNRARYSGHEISDEEALAAQNALKPD